MRAAVLVPIKDFRRAKQRLSDVLSPHERVALAKAMAERVIAAAAPYDVYVVCDDEHVSAFATAHEARALWCPGLGLNGAITAGIRQIAGRFQRVVVAHSDLPLAVDFTTLVETEAEGVALVADRHGRGTNVLALPTTASDFAFQFGALSFHAHQVEAGRVDLPVCILRDDRLAWDVDSSEDLTHPDLQELFPWLPTSPANQHSAAHQQSPR